MVDRISKALFYCVGLGLVGGCASASELEVRTSQSDYVFANIVRQPGNGYEGANNYYDFILPNIAFVNKGNSEITVEEAWIESKVGGQVSQRSRIRMDEIEATLALYAGYAQLNFDVALEVVFGALTMFEDGVTVSQSVALEPGTAALVTDNYILTRGMPDTVTISVSGRDSSGKSVRGEISLAVMEPKSKNTYSFPLESGAWYATAYPGIDSHHRFTQSTEFATDFTLVDDSGKPYRSDGKSWDDWYAYGKKVLAAAPGEVVLVTADSDIDPEEWMPHEGEPTDKYQARLGQRQIQRFLTPGADPREVAGGNYIVIGHANGEYSHYAHLAFGGVRVKIGDTVERGQHIANVGGTGEVPLVHLHFQVMDSAGTDRFSVHGIPILFDNVSRSADVNMDFEPGYFLVKD